ncbi:translation initiation factor IF-5A [archaeon CG10_big_fil_rev_8_21_14_0_10_43_11]|nr:MAG: translation initiation factor IF-5A [archaeon CG10_big_fil_rev_8_21_14_0_10_43_11]
MSNEGEKRHVELHSIKKGSFMIVEGATCRVTDIQMSRPGKHGHAKARVTAVGIIDGKKRVFVKPGDARVEVPIIGKKQAQVLNVRQETKTIDGKVEITHIANVMDLESYETFDMTIPDELVDKVTEGTQVLYWEVMGSKLMQRIA